MPFYETSFAVKGRDLLETLSLYAVCPGFPQEFLGTQDRFGGL